MRTLRFLLITRAGHLTRIGGRHVLRLSHNPATEALYASLNRRLAAPLVTKIATTRERMVNPMS